MRPIQSYSILATVIGTILFAFTGVRAKEAVSTEFICDSSSDPPSTVVITSSGQRKLIIRWVSDVFTGSGWSPNRRCEEVSNRFTNLNNKSQLKYITTGRINGLPVICTASSKGGACIDLLYTLKPGQNATITLQKLFNIRKDFSSSPLNETTPRIYLSIGEILENGSIEVSP